MTSADAAWLHMDRPTNLMVINSVLWFDSPVDWERLKARFRERVVDRFDRFRQRAVDTLTGPRWEDCGDFDLGLHFHHLGLPAPGDRVALQELVSDRVSVPLDPGRPLWEVYVIDGYGSGGAVLVRMHHSIADGIALARVMLTLADDGDGDPTPGFASATDGSPLAGAAHVAGDLARGSLDVLRHPRREARELAGEAVEDARTLAKLLLPRSDPRTAIKGEQRVAHGVAWSPPVDLWRVKRAARALGATVNDVLVGAVAGAVGQYLEERGDGAREVHALVPFNLRPLDEPLPPELGNRFGLVLLALPTRAEDPVLRTLEVKRRMDAIKHGHEGAISYGILGLMGHAPAAVEALLIDYFSAKGSMVLTNVPGPRRTLSVAGSPLRGVLVWAPCSGSVGMSVSLFSYAGKVTAGFLADSGLVPDPGRLAAGFRTAVLCVARELRSGQARA